MDERIAALENLTLQTMTTTGKLEVTEVMADVVNLWCRVENTNKSFPDWSQEQLEQNNEIAERIKDFDELSTYLERHHDFIVDRLLEFGQKP